MTKIRSLDDVLAEVTAYWALRTRTGQQPEETYELFDFFEELARRHRAGIPGPIGHGVNRARQVKLALPNRVIRRARDWMTARLRRRTPAALALRKLLTGGSKPIDERLARALWQRVSDPGAGYASKQLLHQVEQLERTFITKTGEDLRWRLWLAVSPVVNDLACDPEEAMVWLLCRRRPALTAIRADVLVREGGARTIELRINPDLVSPDDVRTGYRQLRRYVLGTTKERLSEFGSPMGLGAGVTDIEARRTLWNELYPMDQYSTSESFRVATSRATSKPRATA